MQLFAKLVRPLVVGLVVAVAGCEPADTGGGGGVGGDGHLAFIQDSRLKAAAEDGSELHFLTNAGTSAADPALSPNGASIAFAYSPTGDAQSRSIYVVSTTTMTVGEGLQVVLDPGAGETFSSPSWDPGSSQLYFISTSSSGSKILTAASAGGGQPTQIAMSITNAQALQVVNASTLLVSTTPTGDLSKVDVSTGTPTPLGVSGVSRFAVSHDGAKVAYVTTAGSITVQDLSGSGTPTTVAASGVTANAGLAFAPDNGFLAYEASGSISEVKLDGTGTTTLFTSATSPTWGP